MSNEFIREERYIVFKVSDLGNSLKGDEIRRLAREYAEHLEQLVKEPLDYVVIEAGWSEYAPTWKVIDVRVTGAQPAPTIAEQDQINAEAAIRSIYGARPNDEDLWQTIVNGMITPAHIAQAVADGTTTPAYIMQPAPSVPELVAIQHQVPSVNLRGECVGYSGWKEGKGLEHWPHRTLYALPGAQHSAHVPASLLVAIADLVTQMEIVARVGFVDTPDDKDSCSAFCVAEGTWLELMSCVESLASVLAAAPEAKP